MIIADSLNATVRNNIEANLNVRTVTAKTTDIGSIILQVNNDATLSSVSTTDGPIIINGLARITAQNVSAGGASGDVIINGLIGDLVLGNISATGDIDVKSDFGEITRIPGTTISADSIQWTGKLTTPSKWTPPMSQSGRGHQAT
jgi:hypothetical protein